MFALQGIPQQVYPGGAGNSPAAVAAATAGDASSSTSGSTSSGSSSRASLFPGLGGGKFPPLPTVLSSVSND